MHAMPTIAAGSAGAVDGAVAGLLLLAAVLGFVSGFVWQVLRLTGVIVSIWVTYAYYPIVAESLAPHFSEGTRLALSAVGVFVACLLVCYLLAFLFRDVVNAIRPQMFDRVLGAGFGMFKGLLLVGLGALIILQHAAPQSSLRQSVTQSRSARLTAQCVVAFIYMLPREVGAHAVGDEALKALK